MRGPLLALALLALALRVLLPAGVMAAPAQDGGGFSIVMCTPEGPRTVAADAATATPDHPAGPEKGEGTPHGSPCVFAGQAAAPPPPLLGPAAPAVARSEAAAPLLPPAAAPGRGLSRPPLPARGPPALLI